MILMIRRILAVLAGCGLVASVLAYLGSYVGTTMDGLFRWAIVLHIGIFHPSAADVCARLLGCEGSHLLLERFLTGHGKVGCPDHQAARSFLCDPLLLIPDTEPRRSPQIKNGEYVLDNHGQIVKVLTQRQYFKLKGAELRLFATGWMFFYFVPAAYWWFPRDRERLTVDASLV
jgi:hypothetical protein